jgi:hypothetical protein
MGITFTHNREINTVNLAMPKYEQNALEQFGINYEPPEIYEPPECGVKIQYDEFEDDRPISAEAKTRIQQIVRMFLFYARNVDPTMLCAVNKLASKQAVPTADTATQADVVLKHAYRYPDATVTISATPLSQCHIVIKRGQVGITSWWYPLPRRLRPCTR